MHIIHTKIKEIEGSLQTKGFPLAQTLDTLGFVLSSLMIETQHPQWIPTVQQVYQLAFDAVNQTTTKIKESPEEIRKRENQYKDFASHSYLFWKSCQKSKNLLQQISPVFLTLVKDVLVASTQDPVIRSRFEKNISVPGVAVIDFSYMMIKSHLKALSGNALFDHGNLPSRQLLMKMVSYPEEV